jgi:3'(2'), 5'-bisphosphate nucleotidase
VTPPVGDGAFARWLATRAGEELLTLRDHRGYEDPAALREAGDKRSHDLLVTALAQWRPGDAVLSEEAVRDDVAARQAAERVWIIDPLDGTREFGEPDRTDWAVHVALWSRSAASGRGTVEPVGRRPDGAVGLEAGAVALPAQHRVLATDQPPGYPPLVDPGGSGAALRLAVSRTRAPGWLAAVAAEVGAELVPMGSAGAKIVAVVTGEVDAYLHAGGQYEWDSAAPVAVALATGLHASRIDGSTLEYNQPDPRLPDLLVCRQDLAQRLLAAVARHAQEKTS